MRPGRVTAWVPTAASLRAMRASPADPRPLTVEQHHHLTAAHSGDQPFEATWIGVACRLDEPTPGSVPAALASFFDRHESLRCDYDSRPGGFARRLLAPGTVEFEARPLGTFSDADEARAAVVTHLSGQAQPLSWPRAGFVTVASPGHTTLYAAFDHVGFDLASSHAAAEELPLLHRAYAVGDGPHPHLALPASHLDHALVDEARLCGATSQSRALKPWRALLAGTGAVPEVPSAAGVCRGEAGRDTLVSMPVATAGETAELAEASARWGADLESVLLALVLRAVASQEGEAPYRAGALLATSGRARHEEGSIGWYARLAPLVVDLRPGEDLATTALRTVEAVRTALPGAQLPAPVVGRLLGVPVRPGLVLGFVDHRTSAAGEAWRLNESRGLLGSHAGGDQVHAWVTCLPEGTFLEARHPDTPRCGGWVATLAVTMRRALLGSLEMRPAFSGAAPGRRGPHDW